MQMLNRMLTVLAALALSGAAKADSLSEGFLSPPDSIKTGVFWYWMNGNVSKDGVIADLEAMSEAGIGMAWIGNIGESTYYDSNYPPGDVKLLSEEWWEVLHTALIKATQLGIDIGIFNCPGWSQSGGPWITPDHSMRYLKAKELYVSGPILLDEEMNVEEDYFEDVSVMAFKVEGNDIDSVLAQRKEVKNGNLMPLIPDSLLTVGEGSLVDISDCLGKDGRLKWQVPEGEWVIMRLGMATTGKTNSPATSEATGLEVDKMSYDYTQEHFKAFLGKIYDRIPAEDRACWKYTVVDSYEAHWQNFTDSFISRFEQVYGYDPRPYLPAYFGFPIGGQEVASRFLWDVRRFIADEIAYQYVAGLRDISHDYGLRLWLENYGHGQFCSEFLTYGGQSDEVSGEFWIAKHDAEKQAAASCAHTYGKRRAWAESFTNDSRSQWPAWTRSPSGDKVYGDKAFAQGINSMLLHVFISQYANDEYPGVDGWFGSEYNRKNTWFPFVGLFVDYIRRCSFMLQQGESIADVAYYIGEDAPKMKCGMNPSLPKGFSSDFINAEMLYKAKVVDGKITLPHGIKYNVLVLPQTRSMRPEVIRCIKRLVDEGATVVGPKPNRSPSLEGYPDADEEVSKLADEFWDKIYKGSSLTELFDSLGLPADCGLGEENVMFAHRKADDGSDIYFLTNQGNDRISITPSFRVSGKYPELWDAVDGSIRKIAQFISVNETTSLHISLEGKESVFVVFRDKDTGFASVSAQDTLMNIEGDWEVEFCSDSIHRGPSGKIVLNNLKSWTESANDSIKYYSGTARYHKKFSLPKKPENGRIFIDFSKVSVMAKVTLNGKEAGGIWTAPFRTEITEAVREGENDLIVEVANTWANRILGDAQLPEEERKVVPHTMPRAKTKLQTSGLIGPVAIIYETLEERAK